MRDKKNDGWQVLDSVLHDKQTRKENKMKITIEKATSNETKAKIAAARKNGYLKYDNLPKDKRTELIDNMAIVLSVCSPTIMDMVMKCQMGIVGGLFWELKDGTPVLLTDKQFLKIFNIVMYAKERAGVEWERVA